MNSSRGECLKRKQQDGKTPIGVVPLIKGEEGNLKEEDVKKENKLMVITGKICSLRKRGFHVGRGEMRGETRRI